jgi:hypothetical protein
MATDAEQAGSWEIATACDIELGKQFRDDGMYAGKVLGINVAGLEETINQLTPEGHTLTENQPLLFQATDAMSPQLNGDDTDLSLGVLKMNRETGDMNLLVSVNGFSHRSVFRHTFLKKDPVPVPVKPEAIHKAEIHELRHAVDYTDTEVSEIFEQEEELTRGNKLYILGSLAMRKVTFIAAGASGGLWTGEALGLSTAKEIIIAAGGAVFASRLSRRGREKAIRAAFEGVKMHKYRKSTAEKRARAAAKHASDYPQIISID